VPVDIDAESGPGPDKNQPTHPFGEVQGHLQSNGAAQTVTDDDAFAHLKGPKKARYGLRIAKDRVACG